MVQLITILVVIGMFLIGKMASYNMDLIYKTILEIKEFNCKLSDKAAKAKA